jgi:hypothetical protein
MSKQKSLTAPGSVAEEVLTDAPESRFGDIRPIDCDGREQQARNLALVVGDRVGNSDEISSALESATAPWRPPRLNPKVLVHGHGLVAEEDVLDRRVAGVLPGHHDLAVGFTSLQRRDDACASVSFVAMIASILSFVAVSACSTSRCPFDASQSFASASYASLILPAAATGRRP